ncbi:MAG: hypothetical protein NTX64_16115 [Elusimicrobia bacterium]|nr:hypothetical protein [Elusimicrobiota bacterium]
MVCWTIGLPCPGTDAAGFPITVPGGGVLSTAPAAVMTAPNTTPTMMNVGSTPNRAINSGAPMPPMTSQS